MATELTLKKVLDKAIEKEVQSQLLYTDLSQQAVTPATRDALQELVRQEMGHQLILEKYQRGELTSGALGADEAVDYRIAERLDLPDVSPDMKLKDVFMLAAIREMAAHEFYLALSEIHPDGELKRLLDKLAKEELEHKQKVETLYTEVAFPQTDGG
jgi:rubrerythrin